MDVYLVRHPRPDVDPDVCHGRLDVPLPAAPEAAGVDRVAAVLPPSSPIVTAPARRCRGFAEPLAARLGSELCIEDRLCELDFGRWEGRPWREIPRAETRRWTKDFWHNAPPDGESCAAMQERVVAAWDSLLGRACETAVLVAPAGPLRALLTSALELPPEAMLRIHLDYGGISLLSSSSGGWCLRFSNR